MNKIKHIVYLMLENRSLDNVLGWLYEKSQPKRFIPSLPGAQYDGLKENTYFNLDAGGNKHWVTKGTDGYLDVPIPDPYEEYEHVNVQLFETQANPPSQRPATMGGFYKDYYTSLDSAYQIMQTYTPHELPKLNGLAASFAVSDRYFASVPTQTNCNRAFAATGNSLGLDKQGRLTAWVNNHFGPWSDPFKLEVVFNQRTLWNVMSDNGRGRTSDWMVYSSEIWHDGFCFTRDMLPAIQGTQFDAHFSTINAFTQQAQAGTLPFFSFLEPVWGLKKWHFGENGNDYHPPCNVRPGEQFLYSIYYALRNNPATWNSTLFIVNFDEHGGTYDHVRPPWNAAVPWGGGSPTPVPQALEKNFGFDRFGVRVPLLLISPFVEPGTVFRSGVSTPFDHTSVIATILTMAGIAKQNWKLGNRVNQAPTFENVLTRSVPNPDIPDITSDCSEKQRGGPDYAYNDLQLGIAHRILTRATKGKHPPEKVRALYERHFAGLKTIEQLSKALQDMLAELKASK